MLSDAHVIDGRLNEPAWSVADAINAFTQTEPAEGTPPSARTVVRVLVGPKALVIGIDCENPTGGQLVSGGESENADWDGIWEAATALGDTGWSAEIWIPLQTLIFKRGLHEWHFNVQRRIQSLLETDRWAFPGRQYQVTQTSRAGLLTGLPDFDLGLGLPSPWPVPPPRPRSSIVLVARHRFQGDLEEFGDLNSTTRLAPILFI